MTRYLLIAALALLTLTGAKARSGADFNADGLYNLQPGVTTVEQAIQYLGRPPDQSQTGQTGNIGHTWLFVQARTSAFSWTPRTTVKTKSATLVFDPDGTFLRIHQLQGITLDPQTTRRLMPPPKPQP